MINTTQELPMEAKASERIRYAWGISSLGNFIAAVSDNGLVAFEFGEQVMTMLDALQVRFPNATIVSDQNGMSDIVAKLMHLVDHPDQDSGIVLDIRGSDYQKQVWTMLRRIPAGETTNYGALAAELGTRDAREVTEAIGSNAIAILIPCHRVLKKDGSISGYRWGVRRKRILLERERQAQTRHVTGLKTKTASLSRQRKPPGRL
jgi:AraC family transcriptional regulator of adaptative response/methylated-DNA-[protein]-cysteine methyltransferase